MRGRVSKEIVGLGLLLIVFIVAGLVIENPNENSDRRVGVELTSDPSIYNDRASGSKALYDWTKRLGYRAVIEEADWSHLPDNSKLLISVAPESTQAFDVLGGDSDSDQNSKLSVSDARGIQSWLRSGRTLLLLTSRLPVNTLFEGVAPKTGSGDGDDDGDADNKPTFGDVIGLTVQATQQGDQQNFVPMQPSRLVAGVDSIMLSSGSSRIARKRRDGEVLFATVVPRKLNTAIVEPAVMVFPVGAGRIIVVADDYFASNRNLSEADNAAFIANILSTSAPQGSPVLFDEFHHGDVTGSPNLWIAMGRPLRAATGQILLVCLLVVAMVAPRFGAIKSLKRGEVRASGEYMTSLAGLYQRAEATVPALEIIYRQFLRDICQRLALPTDVPLDRLADAAARSSNLKPEGIKRLIIACETALDRKQLSSGDLLTLTRQMEQVKRQLN